MKAKLIVLLILLVSGGFLLSNISAKQKPLDVWQGYIEDQPVLVAPLDTGRIAELAVARGDTVEKDAPLFRMDNTDAKAAFDEASAKAAAAQAVLDNLLTGKRPQEIAVTQSAVADAQAALKLAQADYARKKTLRADGFVSQSVLDAAQATLDQSRARLSSAQRQLGVAKLPAREQEIENARQALAAAKAALADAQWKLDRNAVKAPVAGLVQDTIRFAGETASPQLPVIMLTPPDKRVIRFFVPQAQHARFGVGTRLTVTCDGCAAGLHANVTYAAPKAEYTPPVIYSVQSRQKLVFMIEATPQGDTRAFHAGQPVDIRMAP